MKLSEVKRILSNAESVSFKLENGTMVPENFHVTEVGVVSKHFIDCGGTIRTDKVVNFQVWTSTDTMHRLEPNKLLKIISSYEKHFGTEDLEIEVEYQTGTTGRYGLEFKDENFWLTAKFTDCLASDQCGVPQDKVNLPLMESASKNNSCCTPGGGCC